MTLQINLLKDHLYITINFTYAFLCKYLHKNAIAERINGILKQEFLDHYEFVTIEEVQQAVEAAVSFYNTQRPHRSIDMLTPQKAALRTGILPKRWVCYKDKYIQKDQL